MFLSCFEKLQFFNKISFLQNSVHGELGTNIPTVLTVITVSYHTNRNTNIFKSLTTWCRYSLMWDSIYMKTNGNCNSVPLIIFEQCIFLGLAYMSFVAQQMQESIEIEPRHDKMCLREFPTRPDTNRPAQPQKLATVLKFRL